MYPSRSESQRQDKQRRKKRMRRLLIVNGTMLIIIGALIILFMTMGDNKEPGLDEASGPGSPPTAAQNEQAANDPGGEAPSNTDTKTNDETVDEPDAGTNAGAPQKSPDVETGNSGAASGGNPVSGEGETAEQPAAPDNGPQTDDGGTSDDSPSDSPNDGQTIKLSFVGDLLMASSVEELMKKNGYSFPFEKSLPYLQGADLTAGNLENPITERGTPAQNKQYIFKGSPLTLPPLKEAGFDLVTLANNHTLDQGTEGLLDTIGHLDEAGIPHVGGGNDDQEAYQPVYLQAKDMTVAYIGVSRVLPEGSWKAAENHPGVAEAYDSTRAVKAIKEAKEQADLVVVMIHWGIERADQPEPYQKSLGREFIDAGADLIIGSHPHVLQGFEPYKGKWIVYSLGNYIFNMTKTEKTKDTGVLDAVCSRSGKCQLQFHPMRAAQSQPAPLEGKQAEELLARLSGFSIGATVDKEGYVRAKE